MPTPLTHDDPQALGAYRLVARLGSGGMGTVYLARSPGGRTVALKTMHARIASEPAFRTRFRLESDAARVIGGQFGAQVVDADPLAETPWLATEYVLGPPLDDAVELAGPLPEPSVRALGAALCMALGQLHRSDVVHRDLKPSNIMVTAYGPKVIDFGIARALGDDRLTHTGSAVGTPAFMSPEQATGQEHSPAGDVFALAGVLVFAATGDGPFGYGQAADLLYRVRYQEPDLSRVPSALAPILARCLAKDPAQRPSTSQLAAELHDGDGAFADHLPDAVLADIARRASEVWQIVPQRLAPPQSGAGDGPTPAPAAGRTSRRRLLTLGAGLSGAAVLAGAGAWGWRVRGRDGADGKSGAGPSSPRDPVWHTSIGTEPDDPIVLKPVCVRNLVLLAAGFVNVYDARTGHYVRQARNQGHSWQLGVHGDTVYQLLESPELDQTEDDFDKPWPVVIATLNLSDGTSHKPLAKFTDVNGRLAQTQLLCVDDGALYLADGHGPDSDSGFLADQDWFLRAVDTSSGKRLWSQRLPSRPDGDLGLHFPSACVIGRHLVTLQQRRADVVQGVVRDTRTGEVRWDKVLDVDLPTVVLAVDDTHLYVGGDSLRALRLDDGHGTWTVTPRHDDGSFGPPSVVDGVVYAVQDGVGLVAVDAGNGRPLWEQQDGDGDKVDLTSPPVIGTRYAYYRRGVDLEAVSLASHRTSFAYAVSAKRFFTDAQRRMILAVSDDQVEAVPLQ